MFDNLSDKLNQALKKLKGHGKLSEKNISDGLREVRMALLEADVHYKVVKRFVADIKERALGQEQRPAKTRWSPAGCQNRRGDFPALCRSRNRIVDLVFLQYRELEKATGRGQRFNGSLW